VSGPGHTRRVVVLGGGLAGMAAALGLAGSGREVVLCERRPFLGGRAFSFRDPASGAVIDNGQHVLVGACDRLRGFLAAIGSPPDAFVRQRRLAVPILDGRGAIATLSAAPLPPPLHLLPSLLRYRHLRFPDRVGVARDARALARLRDRNALEDVPLGEWLARRGASPAQLERFWEPLITPALNVPVAEANIPLAAFFLDRALWRGSGSGALWLPRLGLSEALGEPGRRALEAAGVRVLEGTRVAAIEIDAGHAVGVRLAGGEALAADAVVSAIAPRDLAAALPMASDFSALGEAPIVNAYLWYDRPVSEHAFAGTFGSPLQWVFDRERLLGAERSGGPCLGVSLSAADEWIERSKEEIAERMDEAVARVFPLRRGARLEASAVVKEPRATFRADAGCGRRRPGPAGPASGLWLAGDWTDTGWPATMEGAVRSGERAASAALSALGEGVR